MKTGISADSLDIYSLNIKRYIQNIGMNQLIIYVHFYVKTISNNLLLKQLSVC